MSSITKIYKQDNYKIPKSINIDDTLYDELHKLVDDIYDCKISDLVNVCIEDLILEGPIKYYPRPYGEIGIYRSFGIRKNNCEWLDITNLETGISRTRLVNFAIKVFLEKQH